MNKQIGSLWQWLGFKNQSPANGAATHRGTMALVYNYNSNSRIKASDYSSLNVILQSHLFYMPLRIMINKVILMLPVIR